MSMENYGEMMMQAEKYSWLVLRNPTSWVIWEQVRGMDERSEKLGL
jgi:hypothetical protein